MYHLHPIKVSLPSRSCLTWIQVPRYLCNLHPCSSSPPSRCTNLHLSSIPISPPIEVLRVAFNLHPNHISTMPGLRDVHLTSIYVHSHCHRRPLIGISSPSRSRFTCILVESQLNLSHDNYISDPPRSNYTPIQLSRHLCPNATPPPPHPTPPPPLPSYTYPGNVSNPSTPPRLTSHTPPVCASPQSSSRYLHLTSTQMMSHLHPCPGFLSHLSKNSSLTMTHIMVHIYPGSISPKSRSKCEFHLHPRPISSPSRPIAHSHLASIQVVSHLNPGLYLRPIFIQKTPQLQSGHENGISVPSR